MSQYNSYILQLNVIKWVSLKVVHKVAPPNSATAKSLILGSTPTEGITN